MILSSRLGPSLLAAGLIAAGIPPQAMLAAPATAQHIYEKAADNHVFAQVLVNQLMAANPDLLSVGIHARPPGGGPYQVVAHSQDLIGKHDDEIDAEIIKGDQTVLGIETVGKTTVLRMVVHEGLHDQGGASSGWWCYRSSSGRSLTRRPLWPEQNP